MLYLLISNLSSEVYACEHGEHVDLWLTRSSAVSKKETPKLNKCVTNLSTFRKTFEKKNQLFKERGLCWSLHVRAVSGGMTSALLPTMFPAQVRMHTV